MRVSVNNIFCWLLVATCFSKSSELFISIGGIGIDLYSYFIMPILFVILLMHSNEFSLTAVTCMIVFFLYEFSVKLLFGLELFPLFKQIMPIYLFYSVAFMAIKRFGVETLFRKYCTLAFYVAVIGIVQYILELIGVSIFVDAPGRLNSIMPEASHFAAVIIPAFIFYYLNKSSLLKSFVLGLSVLLTFSSAAILTVLLTIAIHYRKKLWRAILYTPILLVCVWMLYLNVEEFSYRINDVLSFLWGADIYESNATTFSFFSNLLPSFYSFTSTFGLGSGLGGHPEVYLRYWNQVDPSFINFRLFGLNMISGHSLGVRIVSELGVLGLLGLLYVFMKLFFSLNNIPTKSTEYSILLASSSSL
ncbi:hypothetical protein BOO35_19330, partial [Vibrio navarrensis]|uniref:hypothetical protein n=1 Tax=Vibrio navarrensis TaxID=29495 RepID=UPI0018674120